MAATLQQVFARVPGATKAFVHYLEAQRYIHPEKVETRGGKIHRRRYSDHDIAVIKDMWALHQQHIAPKTAFQLLTSGHTLGSAPAATPAALRAFLLLKTSRPNTQEMLHALQAFEEFHEASIVFGTWDMIGYVVVPDLAALQELVVRRVRRLLGGGVNKTGTLIVMNPTDPGCCWHDAARWQRRCAMPHHLLAYLLLETRSGGTTLVRKHLREMEEVVEAASVYGHQADIVAKVVVEDWSHLTTFVNQTVRAKLPTVTSTTTFPVHDGDGNWRRE